MASLISAKSSRYETCVEFYYCERSVFVGNALKCSSTISLALPFSTNIDPGATRMFSYRDVGSFLEGAALLSSAVE